jgi:hypothetical protein
MTMLNQITRGRQIKPPRLLLYGCEGTGKSTFASQSLRPIFIQTEDGLGMIDCEKFPLARSFNDVEQALQTLQFEDHPYQTVAVDSLDWLEQLIWEDLCQKHNVTSIEKVGGGYGKGYTEALIHWRRILDMLQFLRDERGMCIILVAHSKVEPFCDPLSATYDRYSPRLHKHASALVTEWVDCVLFTTTRFRVETEEARFGHERSIAVSLGQDGGERILRTIGGPSCIAKNRYGLPYELPLNWDAFMAAFHTGAGKSETASEVQTIA